MVTDTGRCVLHVDMDAFFAAVEAQRRGLEGEPVVVCVYSGRSDDSGAVSTASYAARELGIHAGMPIRRAKALASDSDEKVHFLPLAKEVYRQLADEIRETVLEQHAETVEQASIDEAYLDVTDTTASFDEAAALARTIKDEVADGFGLSCSVGVGPNRLVAKIASDREKPDGLTVVRPEELRSFMRSLELADLHGVGEETIEELAAMGIETVAELAEADPARLVDRFGEQRGVALWRKAQGKDDTLVEESQPRQLSRLTTLDRDSSDPAFIRETLDGLADSLIERLRGEAMRFQTVSFLGIDTELAMHTRSRSLASPVQDRDILFNRTCELMETFLSDFDGRLRRVGIRASQLTSAEGQRSLDAFTAAGDDG